MSQVAIIESTIRTIETSIQVAQQQLSQAYRDGNTVRVQELERYLAELNQSLTEARAQLQRAQQDDSLPTVSSGDWVKNAAAATDDGASTQRPSAASKILVTDSRLNVNNDSELDEIVEVPDTTTGTNALAANRQSAIDYAFDFGTNGELRPLTKTQSVPIGSVNQGQTPLTIPSIDGRENIFGPGITPGGYIGFGSPTDDAGSNNATRAEIDNIFNEGPILPKNNVLDQYASYNYVASVYLVSTQGYNKIMQDRRKSLEGAKLLFQSAGSAVGQKSEYFANDYYIDRIELKSKELGKGSGQAHNVSEMKITVTEPNGISFVENLDKAVQAFMGGSNLKKKGYTAQPYLLVIRFYGYDDQGNLVRGGVAKPDGSTDPNAFVEKFYPFHLANVNFKVSSKLVEYTLDCKPIWVNINASTDRGTIPYNIELSGQTLKDLLAGPAVYSSNQDAVSAGGSTGGGITVDDNGVPLLEADVLYNNPPAKANAAPSKKATIRQGLMAAMNAFQQQLVQDGQYEIADEYSIEFITSSLENARVTIPGVTDKKSTPNATPKTAADQKLPEKQSMDTGTRIIPATAGLQILQFLDQTIRNSSYLRDQAVIVYDPTTGEEKVNGVPAKNVAWFKISMQTEIKGWDNKRNCYAYRVKYIVHPYKISQMYSRYYPIPEFNGVAKRYNYWFTGQNTSVLNYEENLNSLYHVTLTGGVPPGTSSSLNQELKYNFQPRSGESSQGAQGKANEPMANAADGLYSPSDLKECTMSIVGDPAWLQQGEAFAWFNKNDPYLFRAFLADGTINADSQQPLFEVCFNRPRDYNLGTGLVEPNKSIYQDIYTGEIGKAEISRIYIAKEVVSDFNRGKFTQTISGGLLIYDPSKIQQANQDLALNSQLSAIQNFSLGRVGGISLSSIGSLVAPSFFNGLTNFGAVANVATNFGINYASSTASSLINNVLGSQPTRTSPVAQNPTSFGLSVGSSVLNSLNFGTANFPSLATPPYIGGEVSAESGTVTGTDQIMTAGDDAGYGSDFFGGFDILDE
jgi:hypothetical protein